MKLLLNKEESAKVMEVLVERQPTQNISGHSSYSVTLLAKYYGLLNEVQTKVPGETRHQTAKRFIKEKEERIPCSDGLKGDRYGIL